MKNFKRKKIINQAYLLKLVHYIHHNPIETGLCKESNDWKHSSFNSIIAKSPTLIDSEKVIEWFDDIENFNFVHQQKAEKLEIVFD